MFGFRVQGARRDKGAQATISAKDGVQTGDFLNRDLTATVPNRYWRTSFDHCRT